MRIADAVQGQDQGLGAPLPHLGQEGVHGGQGDGLPFAQDALVPLALAAPVQAVHGLAVDHDALLPGGGAELGRPLPGGGGDAEGLEFAPFQGFFAGVGAQVAHQKVRLYPTDQRWPMPSTWLRSPMTSAMGSLPGSCWTL